MTRLHQEPTLVAGRSDRTASVHAADRDDTDYAHRHFTNLLAAAFLLAIALAILWTVNAINDDEKLRTCFDTGKRDCIQIGAMRPAQQLSTH